MLVLKRELFFKGEQHKTVAKAAGIDPASLSRIANGKEGASTERRKRIADALGWQGDPAELFEEIEVR